jgi:hypothetical protein
LTTEAAAQLLGLERRQVFRLLKAYRAEGDAGLISKRRGRRSNRPEALRQVALALIRERIQRGEPLLPARYCETATAAVLTHQCNASSPSFPNWSQARSSFPSSRISANAAAQPSRGHLLTGVIAMRPSASEMSIASPAASPISANIDFGMITPDEFPSFRMAVRTVLPCRLARVITLL